jgi:hypothetical protein
MGRAIGSIVASAPAVLLAACAHAGGRGRSGDERSHGSGNSGEAVPLAAEDAARRRRLPGVLLDERIADGTPGCQHPFGQRRGSQHPDREANRGARYLAGLDRRNPVRFPLRERLASLNQARSGHSVAALNALIHLFDGVTAPPGGFSDTVQVFDPAGNQSSDLRLMFHPNERVDAVSVDGEIHAVSGRDGKNDELAQWNASRPIEANALGAPGPGCEGAKGGSASV